MKRNLTKSVLTVLIFLNINVFALEYIWSASVNKTSAHINEAIHLQYICEFEGNGELYTIDFDPMGDYEKYTIRLLREDQLLQDGNRVNSYDFIAYPKVSGEVSFDFDMTMKKTTQESINYTTKSRDDDRDHEAFTSKILRQQTLSVKVEDTQSELVGEFSLRVKKDELQTTAYKPFHLEVIIEGTGNFSAIKELEYKIDGVKIFAQKPTLKTSLGEKGESGIWSQKFAFVSKEDFTIPLQQIRYFNLFNKELENLDIKESVLELKKVYIKEELLDTKEEGFSFTYDYLYYLLTFIAGFLVAKIKLKRKDEKYSKSTSFDEKIKQIKSLEELIMILAIEDSKKYENIIIKVETKEVTSLKEVKKLLGV